VPQTGDENPIVYPLNMSMMPLVVLSLGGDMAPNEISAIAAEKVLPELEAIEGVFSVDLEGGGEKVLIIPDAEEMNSRGIPVSQLVAALSSGQYGSLEGIGEAEVNGTTRVGDVAEIDIGPAPGTAMTRTNGQNSVGIMVTKAPEANTVTVANAVVDKIAEIQPALLDNGDDVELVAVFDQSDYIERSIGELTQEAVIGGGLAVLVILLFLMTVRGSLVVAISIPLSILVGFLVMWAWGITINILTLSAMAIAVGRIVDDSIVVLEVIYRRLRHGEGFREAAIGGAREVAVPITSATLATIAIFLPLAFVGGIVGEMFVPFALTITFALMASLVVSLMVVPPLSSVLVPKKLRGEPVDSWYQRIYTPALKWALAHRVLTLVIAVALFLGSGALLPMIGTSFMPSMSEKMLMVDIETPLGTDQQTTSEVAALVEDAIGSIHNEGDSKVQLYYTTVGTSSSFIGGFSAMFGGGGANQATIEILLDVDADMEKEADRLSSVIGSLESDAEITVSPMESMFGDMDPSTMRLNVLGDDYEAVKQAATELASDLGDVEGLGEIANDIAITLPKPKIEIEYLPQDMNVTQVEQEMYAMMAGAGTGVEFDGRELYVTGIMQSANDADELEDLRLFGGLPVPVRLGVIASVDIEMQPTNIRRIDEHRSATITSDVTEKDVGSVNRDVQEKIDAFSAEGVDIEVGGVAEEMEETFSDMGIAIIIAIIIAFAIVVISFRSIISPLIIMVSLPLASIGALLGLLITGYPVGASALMGMLMLVGIVLTNAIVLVALVEQLRGKGVSTYDALVEAGRTRLRPILMTALTTMIALVPLAVGLGEGVLLAAELAVVVIGGLFSSTLLTLLVIPVLYSLTARFRRAAPRRAF
jgi:HAE1 family hydrophobic/amphiphilic exporter-1